MFLIFRLRLSLFLFSLFFFNIPSLSFSSLSRFSLLFHHLTPFSFLFSFFIAFFHIYLTLIFLLLFLLCLPFLSYILQHHSVYFYSQLFLVRFLKICHNFYYYHNYFCFVIIRIILIATLNNYHLSSYLPTEFKVATPQRTRAKERRPSNTF